MPKITVVCCECQNYFWEEEVSSQVENSYDDKVEQEYDSNDGKYYPRPKSYFEWEEKEGLDFGACPDCGCNG